MKPLEEAGFACPKLNYALRNPVKIADYAQKVIQDGAKNSLDGILRSPIKTSMQGTNMADGMLIRVKCQHDTPQEALRESIKKVPHGKRALYFIDNDNMSKNNSESVLEAFSTGPMPIIPKESAEMDKFKVWLCEPEKRDRDVCIVGTQHQCNGIETDVVVHVYVADCPMCGISNTDPVILSRAKAMLILSTYKRLECPCGWKKDEEIDNDNR